MLTVAELHQYVREHMLLVLGVAVLFLAVLFALFQFFGRGASAVGPQYEPPRKDDHVLGDLTRANSVLVVYMDLECPACNEYHPMIRQMERDLHGDLAVVYRHFPLSAIHPNAQLAAQAAEAAHAQGKFFEMVDLLYARQREWAKSPQAESLFVGYAESLGVEKDAFVDALHASAVVELVKDSEAAAQKLHIMETPTFFLDGVHVPVPRTTPELKAMVTQKLYGGR